jgi:hypothetical protein
MYLLADNIRNEIVTIHRSQEVLKILSLYEDIPYTSRRCSDLPFESVIQEYLQFPYEYFLSVLFPFGG